MRKQIKEQRAGREEPQVVTSAAALASARVSVVSTPDTSHGPNTLSSTRPDLAADADAATALAAAGSSTVTFTSTLTLPADAARSTAAGSTPSFAATSPLLVVGWLGG